MANYLLSETQKGIIPIISYGKDVLVDNETFGDTICNVSVENAKTYYVEMFLKIINTTSCTNGFKISLASGTASGNLITTLYKYNVGSYDVTNSLMPISSKKVYSIDLTTTDHVYVKIEGFVLMDNTAVNFLVYPVTNGQTCTVKESITRLTKIY